MFSNSSKHTDIVGYCYHDDGSVSVDIGDTEIKHAINTGRKTDLKLVITPLMLSMLGRFLLKVGIELIASTDCTAARSVKYDAGRRYSRFGDSNELWPIFHFSHGKPWDFKRCGTDDLGELEPVDCYRFALLEVAQLYTLLHFGLGTDNWVVCINDRCPDPIIRDAFPDATLNLMWYSADSWKR